MTTMRLLYRANPVVTIPLVVLTGLTLVPFAWVVTSALKSNSEIFGGSLGLPTDPRWSNFETAWTSARFSVYFVNSLLIAVVATAITLLVSCPAGYAFGKLAGARLGRSFGVYLLAMAVPVEAMFVPIFYQLRAMGLVDTRWGLILVLVATGTPLGVFLMRNQFRDLPNELLESARIDGATEWTAFVRVMLPLAKPAALALAVFSFLGAWNEYQLALVLLISDQARTIPLGLLEFQGQYGADYGALFAGIAIAMVPSIVVYVVLQRTFTRGLVLGAIK